MAIGIHLGAMKTKLSKDFWNSAPRGRLWEPDEAARRVLMAIRGLNEYNRRRV